MALLKRWYSRIPKEHGRSGEGAPKGSCKRLLAASLRLPGRLAPRAWGLYQARPDLTRPYQTLPQPS
jgi:hypothetical protein